MTNLYQCGKIYATEIKEIAIRSTFDALTHSFHKHKDHRIYVGQVKYLDFDNSEIPRPTILSGLMYKRRSFTYENEVQAVINRFEILGRYMYFDRIPFLEMYPDQITRLPEVVGRHLHSVPGTGIRLLPLVDDVVGHLGAEFTEGVNVDIDLETLVHEIRISPAAPAWFGNAVRKTAEKFGINPDLVKPPDLGRGPVY